MKHVITICFLFLTAMAQAQLDTVPQVEPNRETSYTNQDLLLISFAALAILIAIYFLFRRVRKTRN